MSTQTWHVDVDGVPRQIVAETDEASGRTSIRVDGRMVARPLATVEEERHFTLGSIAYVLRRLPDGALDLDIAPPQFQPPPAIPTAAPRARTSGGMTRVPPPKEKKTPIGRIILSALLLAFLGAAFRYGAKVVTYMSVPWKSYTSDDKQFRVKFAGDPEKSVDSVATSQGSLRAVQLKSKYEGHFYIVEHVDLPAVIPDDRVNQTEMAVMKGLVEEEKWKLLSSDLSRRGIGFVAEVPQSKEWSEGTARGRVIVEGDRLYIIYAFVPRGEALSWDVGEFLRSVEIAE
jgi:hypothetical protein